jgi:hypothetical protein
MIQNFNARSDQCLTGTLIPDSAADRMPGLRGYQERGKGPKDKDQGSLQSMGSGCKHTTRIGRISVKKMLAGTSGGNKGTNAWLIYYNLLHLNSTPPRLS